jgi:hypothetical protein
MVMRRVISHETRWNIRYAERSVVRYGMAADEIMSGHWRLAGATRIDTVTGAQACRAFVLATVCSKGLVHASSVGTGVCIAVVVVGRSPLLAHRI